jgi:polysaccharide deacetylase family protein (PEP-CTERM system associated)
LAIPVFGFGPGLWNSGPPAFGFLSCSKPRPLVLPGINPQCAVADYRHLFLVHCGRSSVSSLLSPVVFLFTRPPSPSPGLGLGSWLRLNDLNGLNEQPMLNALTVDVEDYFQVSAFDSVVRFEDWDHYESRVERNTQRVLDLLDEYKTKGTFFVLGWIAERYPELVRLIHDRGHEVASHGYSHKCIYTQSPEQFRAETRRSKGLLEDLIGQTVIGYRAASYSITARSLWALDILVEEGFRYDSSIFPVRHDRYGIPGHPRFFHKINGNGGRPIAEVPLSTIRMAGMNFPVAGGGYLRIFPHAINQLAISYLNRIELQPAVVYFHPWELDPEQPRIAACWLSHFRQYTNLRRMEARLRKLLSSFDFAPVREVYAARLNLLAATLDSDAA